jgi:hypothetical protein
VNQGSPREAKTDVRVRGGTAGVRVSVKSSLVQDIYHGMENHIRCLA